MDLARSVEEELTWSPVRHTSKEGYVNHRWEGRHRSMDPLMGRGITVEKYRMGRAQFNERMGVKHDPTRLPPDRHDGISSSTPSTTPRQATPNSAYVPTGGTTIVSGKGKYILIMNT
ncbi:hypothetical protein F511_33175 [Dorcoceras hygrometricum]|uniref:Uncharacterized protein n=1 Tax=Dorcoceras hygrometricum TaxID=472368 RepID=A0A2Z7D0N5_9LAMI|nr:hypothetical protein F511_33175 [Dorcoceras hygrometricum]